jgi:sugar lactone lactonase YvrE
MEGSDADFVLVGSGLASGSAGSPGSPGAGLSSSKDLPEGGARGCVYHEGSLYVADAQNAQVVRFDEADTGEDVAGVALEDTPAELATYPTGVAVNEEGDLIVISYDNAHAFVSLEMPGGGFIDNGLHDLNVNAGNYGVALADGTIWFTRANNSNGSLRAVTPTMETLPTTAGPFPPQ